MKYLFFSLLIALSITAQGQLITDSILIEQHYRTFHYYKPAKDIAGGSLMFVLHGSGGSGTEIMKKTTRLESLAGKEKLLVVYPDGYLHYWNECRKYSTAAANKENINENDFFTGMIQYFQTKYGIGENKIFAAGFSGGGQMAYKFGLTMPAKIKAITAIVANMPDSASCDCTFAGKPMPVLIINGTADNVNPFNGGEMFVNNASYGVVRSTENTFHYWSSLAGYSGLPEKELLPDVDTADHKTIESYSYHQKNKPPVRLLKVVGGRHDYPGDIDVYVYAWEFFKSIE